MAGKQNNIPAPDAEKALTKGEKTRLLILRTAREVFTTTSFQGASIRNIADKAGVRHPLVLHYFKSKTALFEAVAAQIQAEILDNNPRFLNQLRAAEQRSRIALYLDGSIRQGLRYPDAYRMILLNAVEVVSPLQPFPGLDRMVTIHEKTITLVSDYLLSTAPKADITMFMIVFTLVSVHYIGGRAFHQHVLGLSSDAEYEEWVRDTVSRLLIPVLTAIPKGRSTFMAEQMGRWGHLKDSLQSDPTPQGHQSEANLSRGEITRKRILDAARQVFATYPYDRATIRMIGKAGHFDFSRIHHFFPTKARLFEAVIQDAFSTFVDTISLWQKGAAGLGPVDLFIHYLGKGLTYCFENRDTVSMLVINIAHYEHYKNQSGFTFMTRVHSNMLKMVKQNAPAQIPFDDMSKWLYTIVMTGYTFAGAPNYPARVMSLAPDSTEYRQKVFETLCFVFMPSMLNSIGAPDTPAA